MEIGILGVAASGLRAQQNRIDFVGQNLANLDTTGYRALRPELVDVPTGQTIPVVSPQNQTMAMGEPNQLVAIAGVTQRDVPGPIVTTGSPLDIAMPPNIYLPVRLPSGQVTYTRNGHLQLDGQGRFQVDGNLLNGSLQLRPGATSPSIDPHGNVVTTGPQGTRTIGTLPLVRIANPGQLQPLGQGLYQVTPDSGPAQPATLSGQETLIPNALEGSNVQADQEFGHLIRAQRAYQVGTQLIRTWDSLASDAVRELGHS